MSDEPDARVSTMPAELLALRRQFAQQLGTRLDAIRAQYQRLLLTWTPGDVEILHRLVHSLTGSAGTLGMPALSSAARLLEHELAAMRELGQRPQEDMWRAIGAQIDALQADDPQDAADEAHAALPNAEAHKQQTAPLIHLGVGDAALSTHLENALHQAGYRARVFDRLEAMRDALVEQVHVEADRPAVVVLDSTLTASDAEREAFLAACVSARDGRVPVVMALTEDTLEARLTAWRAGVSRTLTGPLQAGCVVEALGVLTARQSKQVWRVLLVDDEPLLLEAHAAILRAAGMEVRTLADPLKTLDVVERFEPDVLLLDVYMPQASGPEVAAALRERDTHLHLPILFLSSETDMTQQLLALNLGGDDFLIKPVSPDHLVAAITARARRAQQLQAVQKRLETTLYERQREHLALDHHAIVSIIDRAGNTTYVNDLFCKISGYAREELLGHSHSILKLDQHPSGFLKSIGETISRNQVWQGEMCKRRKDGSTYWAETTVTPFMDDAGQLYQYVVIQTDISHIKATEAALRRQHDMQRMTSVAAARLMATPASGTGKAIETALRNSGEQLGVDRADLYGFSEDGDHMRNLYSWCSTDRNLDDYKVQQTLIDETPWMREQFLARDMVVIPDVAELPPEADEDRRLLSSHMVRALLVIPLYVSGRLSGFMSYSSASPHPEWTPGHVGLLRVLTEVVGSAMARKRDEQALRDSEARLSFLVSSSPVTIYTCDTRPPFAATYVSPNVGQLLGFDADAFLKNPGLWMELVHPEDQALIFEELPSVVRRGSHHHEYRSRTKDGDYKWIHADMRLVRDAEGRPLEVIGYAMDISERKRIEQELFEFNHELEERVMEQAQSMIESERISRATLDAMSARVVILDEGGLILATNQAWRDFRQTASGDEALREGGNYLALCDRQCDTGVAAGVAIAAGIRAVMAGDQQAFVYEYTSHLPGEERWFLCRVEPFPGGGAVRVVVSHENITQMKLVERQQMRSQRLESLGTLAGGVAHDLNNALAPILMGMEMLKEDYPEETQVLEMIQGSARRGAGMVRQLLAFAKGAEGERAAVEPSRIVAEVESMMRGSFPKNIAVESACESDLPVVMGDSTQLHQILLNLCVNARDAMPDGGTITVEGRVVEVDAVYASSIVDAKPGRYVALRVRDTGTGIPPAILERIFDPFFTTKALDKGTGLGLSTVLGIVKGHGGFLQVHSQAGQGSTFSVYLPAQAEGQEASPEVMAEAPFRGHGETVLFVDDEASVREVGRQVLQRLNFKPLTATDGADGLVQAATQQGKLSAIVTDLHMPHMDGLAFVRALRRTLPQMPVIVASGRVDDSAAAELKALGVTVRLDKPFTEVQLANALKSVLEPGRAAALA